MTEITLFECDVTGERLGVKNDVLEYEIRKAYNHKPFDPSIWVIHIDLDYEGIPYPNPSCFDTRYIGVSSEGKIQGIFMDGKWYDRGSKITKQYEEFYQFLEDEVLY